MITTARGQASTPVFHPEEEVVARLSGAAFVSARVSRNLPRWIIGTVSEVNAGADQPLYRLHFRWGGKSYDCVVEESAIEGVA